MQKSKLKIQSFCQKYFSDIFLCFTFCTLIFAFSPAFAALDLSEIGVGARPLGMGKAFISLADDASAVFLNPAGLARNNNLNLVSMSGTMFGDVNYLVVGAADNSPLGKFGIGFINSSVSSIPLTTITGSGSTAAISQYGATDFNSSQLIFAYGSKLSRFLKNGAGSNIAFGGSLKYFLQGFSGGGAPMQEAVGGGMDADFGLIWDASRAVSLGLNLQNFLPVSFGGKFVWQKNSVVEGLPLTIKTGGVFHLIGATGMLKNPDGQLDLLIDYENTRNNARPAVWHAGVEYWPVENFTLRAGVDQKAKASEAGIGVDNNLTAGLGLLLGGFTFDYAYHQFGDLSENTTHFFSIGYRGEDIEKELAKKRAERKRSSVPIPEVVAKPELKNFWDVPEDYWAKRPIDYLTTLGIFDGFEDGSFQPTKEMSRGEMAVVLVRAKGLKGEGTIKYLFADVPKDSGKAEFISLSVEKEYFSGYSDGTFRPEQPITRAEMANIMAKFSGFHVKSKISNRAFPDLSKEYWAAPAIAAAKQGGLFEYLSGQGFGPDLNITRAEAAEIVSKTPPVKKQIQKLISSGTFSE